jgi:parvulin-like peptidyl-prolyl isomerase
MSIRGMQRRMSRHLRIVLYVTIGVFIVGLPAVFVPQFAARRNRQNAEDEDAAQVIARVDGRTVSRGQVEALFDQMMMQMLPFYAQYGQSLRLEQVWPSRLEALEQAIAEELLVKQAETEGISASRTEVRALAEQRVDRDLATLKASLSGEQLEMQLGQLMTIMEGIPRDRVTERRFRDAAIKRLLEDEEVLRREVVVGKLRQKVIGSISTTEQELLSEYDEATVRGIQVALHPEGKPERTEEEARTRAEELAARAKGGEDFAGLARAESDDPEAKETGGLMESVRRATMPLEWIDPVFALAPDEISSPIKSAWGFAVVKMEKVERKLPEDFESRKEELLGRLVQDKQDRAWFEYQQGLRESAQVETLDPEMLAWQALMEQKDDEALAKLQEATTTQGLRKGLAAGAMFYQLGSLLEAQEQWDDAAEAYGSSYDSLAGLDVGVPGGPEQAVMGMARCHENLGDTEEALEWYQVAASSELPLVHVELQGIYTRLGREDLATAEQEWLDDYQEAELKRQQEMEAQQRELEGAQGAGEGQPGPALPGAP